MTKDERFLLAIYKSCEGKINISVNPDKIGQELGYSDRQVKTMLRWLLQANFLKRSGNEVALTERGHELSLTLL